MTTQERWPALAYDEWIETYDTLHFWMQVVGKVKLALCPFMNEWWHVAFTVTPRGLTTNNIPFEHRVFSVDFDLVEHKLEVNVSDGATRSMRLQPMTVAEFYKKFMALLLELGITVTIDTKPTEVESTILLDRDTVHHFYDPKAVGKFRQILVQVSRVFQQFRSEFYGKSSPVHFFWGSFDLTNSRSSGRGCALVEGSRLWRLSCDEELFDVGFWMGSDKLKQPAFYAYALPAPEGFYKSNIRPEKAHFDAAMGEFILLYDDVRSSASPDEAILDFLHSTYEAAAKLGNWNRAFLERHPA